MPAPKQDRRAVGDQDTQSVARTSTPPEQSNPKSQVWARMSQVRWLDSGYLVCPRICDRDKHARVYADVDSQKPDKAWKGNDMRRRAIGGKLVLGNAESRPDTISSWLG